MTSRTPSRRLTDILQSNRKDVLLRNSAELAQVYASLPAKDIQTRFMRNKHLISPKALCLLSDESVLLRWCTFAVYKPPFCPMRRAEAYKNYHKVSIESFVEAAVRSRTVHSVVRRELRPEEVKVRVLNDLDTYASGPVVVSVADRHSFSTSLQNFTMRYDVLVAGHIPLTEQLPVNVDSLFSSFNNSVDVDKGKSSKSDGYVDEKINSATNRSTDDDGLSSLSPSTCTYQVKQNAYYSVHPVSLLEFTIVAPPTAFPPRIEAFVRENLATFVLGDPAAPMGSLIGKAAGGETQNTAKFLWNVVAMRGDCDFPRVFTHLREVSINADVSDAAGMVVSKKSIEFHCRRCFEPLLQRERIYSFKGRRMGLLDGSWTPGAEFA